MIRRCTAADLPFMLAVAADRYDPFDRAPAAEWGARALADPNTLCLRSEHGFAIATLVSFFWRPAERTARLLFLACRTNRGLEGYRLLKAVADAARASGADSLHFGTETLFDLSPIARRLGAVQARPTWALHFPKRDDLPSAI